MSNFNVKSKYINTDEINSSIATFTNLNVNYISGNTGTIQVNNDMNLDANYVASQTAFHDYVATRATGKLTIQDNIEMADSKSIKVDTLLPKASTNLTIGSTGIHTTSIVGTLKANTIVPNTSSTIAIGSTGSQSAHFIAPIYVDQIRPYGDTGISFYYDTKHYEDIYCYGSVKTDVLMGANTGKIAVTQPLKLESVALDASPTNLLTHGASGNIDYIPITSLSTRKNEFFDDFTLFTKPTRETVTELFMSFDKPWYFYGNMTGFNVTQSTNNNYLTNSYRNGMSYLYFGNGENGRFMMHSMSGFEKTNGDITFQCSVCIPNVTRSYFTDQNIFFGLGSHICDFSDINQLTYYCGFYCPFTYSGSPNSYYQAVFNSGSGIVRYILGATQSTGFMTFKMIVKTSTVEYYVDGVLVRIEAVTFPSGTILQPRIGYYVVPSGSNPADGRRGLLIDYVYASQNFDPLTII